MAFTSATPLSAAGRTLWADVESSDEEEVEVEIIYINGAAVHRGTETPSNGTITRTTFRSTPVYVTELANMRQKTFMCHSGDTMARLRGLIFSKFGIPLGCQRLLFLGAVVGGDTSLHRVVHVSDLRVVEVCVKMPGGIAVFLQLDIPPHALGQGCCSNGHRPNTLPP